MNVLCVGAAGYIGTAVTTQLLDCATEVMAYDNLSRTGKHELGHLMSNQWFQFIRGDVADIDMNKFSSADCVINLAALNLPSCEAHPNLCRSTNEVAAIKLAKECVGRGIHYVFSSTCSNYGVKTDSYAVETDKLVPTSNYARSKVEVENAIKDWKDVTILRFATAYGAGAMFRPDLLLHEFIHSALTNHKIVLRGANFYRPLCHIDDIAMAVCEAVMGKKTGIYNIGGTENNYKKQELAEMVQFFTNCDIEFDKNQTDPRNYKVSFEKAKQELHFTPYHNIKKDIELLVDYHKQGLLNFGDSTI